jgi:hypothetical protein
MRIVYTHGPLLNLPMHKRCRQCSAPFEITKNDLAFYEKVSPVIGGKRYDIPPPTLCQDCRFQRRMVFRNERCLYHRKCDSTGKQIISVYSTDKPLTVYDPVVWWSDAYDPLAYGQEVDLQRPFFAQLAELHARVPKAAIHNANSENCDYTNYSAENRNCYLVVGGLGAEDCLYCYRVFYSKDLVDCFDLIRCERCYECSESEGLHSCVQCRHCRSCTDCWYCEDCTGCTDCFGCVNLRNKRHCIYNVQFTPEEYRDRIVALRNSRSAEMLADIRALRLSVPHRFAHIVQSESSSGDQLLECRNCGDCYTFKHSQDCRFCMIGENCRDCYDCNFTDNCELQIDSSNLEKNYHILFGMLNWYCKEAFYCLNSFNSHHCFGCSGLKKHSYCILNKQYSREDYEALVPKIIEKMITDGEWGEFPPVTLSLFGYNETVAQEYFPLSTEEVLSRGCRWHEEEQESEQYLGPVPEIPDAIGDVTDAITKHILRCEMTGKPYKIIPQELKFYRDMHLSVPRRCPDQRHKERMALRNPRKLWKRTCAKCSNAIETTYAPERPEQVYCEQCYLSTVY